MSPRVVYFVTEDWYFWSHRLALACAARDAGYEVIVGTRTGEHAARIRAAGLRVVEIPFTRALGRPAQDLAAVAAITRCLWRERPAIVHLVSLKPILLGGIAARLAPRTAVVNAMTGLGYVFTSDEARARRIQTLVVAALKGLVNGAGNWLVVQNADDAALLRERGIGREARTVLIPGSGVDTRVFAPAPAESSAGPLVVLPARLLRDKGVGEFVAAARRVRRANPAARFALVGPCDADNPAGVDETQVRAWVASGAVEWWGARADMAEVCRQATIVCLPSYREGLPKALLEGAACGRPLVATDVPGCREICRHEVTGLLVPPGDAAALAAAIESLIADPECCARLGANARALVEREFTAARICAATLALYDRLAPVRG